MGNSSSRRRRGSDECKSTTEDSQVATKKEKDFGKSVSMGQLDERKKRESGSSKFSGKSAQSQQSMRSNGVARQKSIRRDISHPISAQGREIIVQCFDNPHSEFGNKVCQRVFEKRIDYQNYVYSLGKDKSSCITHKLKDLVESVVARIDDVDFITNISRAYGEEHVEMKTHGFKPDFWVALADAITVEGVILDMANHQPADTVAAWSQLVSLMFSSVRDGYYTALRAHRMNSRKNLARQATSDSNQLSTGESSSRQNSLTGSRSVGEVRPNGCHMYAADCEDLRPRRVPIFE